MSPGSGQGTKIQPRGRQKSGVVKRLESLLDDVVLPESEYPSGTNHKDRQMKLLAVEEFRTTQHQAQDVLTRIDAELDEEKEVREEWRKSDDDERRALRESDEFARKKAEKRRDFRQVLEGVERLTASADRSRAETTLIRLIVVTVLSAIALAFLAVLKNEPIWLSGACLSSLVSGGEAYVFRLVSQGGTRSGGRTVEPGDPEAPGPRSGSGIEARAWMAEGA